MATQALWAALLVVLVATLHKALSALLWKPLRIQKLLAVQGIRGPPYRAIVGNLPEFSALMKVARASPMPCITHDILPRILPHYPTWSAQYGKPFVYWLGTTPRMAVADPDLCKEVLTNKLGNFQKSQPRLELLDLLANGLVLLEGEKWAQHKRIVNPAFFVEKLKAMVPTIANLANGMLDKWQSQLQGADFKEVDVCEEFKTLTADIIAHTAFGSSYVEGKQVFQLQYEQQGLFANIANRVYIPGSRFIPTRTNQYRWRLNREIKTTLEEIIQKRLDCSSESGKDPYGNDLLGLMLAAYKEEMQGSNKNQKMSLQEIIDECKTFFFAGHETTSSLLTWTIMLLAINSEWQEQAREEVRRLIGMRQPDADSLNHLKIIGMVLNEAFRLYPPAIAVFREARKDTKLGDVSIPEGTSVLIPIMALHVDSKFWGPDALEFNPHRFANGVSKACNNASAFLPFGSGVRICAGQNFALMEAKIVLCMILQRFRFRVSPAYKHAPSVVLTLQPEYGMQILLEHAVLC